jgi:ribosomal protein S18 acetylase RimI-like enzyme
MPTTIREAQTEDIAALAALLAELMTHHGVAPLSSERAAAVIAAVLRAPTAWYFVAEVEGRLAGMVQVNERFSTWDAASYGYIEDFCVAEEWRGRRIGTLLLDHLAAWAKGRGWTRLDLDVSASLTDSVRFYARRGYEDTGSLFYRLRL